MKEERLPKIALDRYRGLSEEEKKEEKKNTRETDIRYLKRLTKTK